MTTWDELVADADKHMRHGKHPREWSLPPDVAELGEREGLNLESLRLFVLTQGFARRLDELNRRQMPPEE